MRTTWVCVFGLLLLAGCEHPSNEPELQPVPIPFENLERADGFRIPNAGTSVIRSDSAWHAYWSAYWDIVDGSGNKTPPPTVDFGVNMVVAVYYGDGRYSGCSSGVKVIEKIERIGNTIRVTVQSLPFLGFCDDIIAPVQMVTVPQSGEYVVFAGMLPS